ncbi:hypothetical protein Q8A67_008275 [Cirrhinus molitorella]|uniref:Rapunzel n=1 Tax=Cirrhinus molitorella TaxID=172907 RepID=A0AA88PYA8_9TELE|nr:hypothetical protein Q8A67_008275 [Cirrhinus molitorella]
MADNEIFDDPEKLKRGLVKVLECVATISSAAAVVNPIFGVAGSLIRVVLHHVDDEDIQKLKREFSSVNRALDEISQQNRQALLQIRKETLDKQYHEVEENIRNQFRKFMEIVEAKPEHVQRKKDDFVESFINDKDDQNMYTLYDGVMGKRKLFSQPILDVYMKHSQGDQRVMENLCTRLAYLFCIGFIALMGYYGILGDDLESRNEEWEENMKNVQEKMQEPIPEGEQNFGQVFRTANPQPTRQMPNPLERVVAQKKEAIEAVMEMFERGAEVLASAVGELCPLFEASAPVLRLVLDNVESKEVTYVKDQFLVVRSKLDVLSSQIEDINSEIKKGRLDSQFFSVEENICNQFRKYIDILEAKPEYKEVRKRLFLQHFPKTGGEKNLYMLYDAVMGNSIFGEPILDVVEQYEARNRRVLEDFCVRLKELLCLGIISLLGYCFLTQGEESEQEKIQEWSTKIQEIETKMKEAIEKCVDSFPEQAELDIKRIVKEKEDGNLQETAGELLDFLVRKYDWVSWSIRVVSNLGKIRNLRAGQNFQCVAGQNCFEVSEGNDTNLVVSFSSNPQPVPNESVKQIMEGPARKGDAKAVVELLENQLAGFLVHAISRHKDSFALSSFPEECHYWEKHKNVNVCVHSE